MDSALGARRGARGARVRAVRTGVYELLLLECTQLCVCVHSCTHSCCRSSTDVVGYGSDTALAKISIKVEC